MYLKTAVIAGKPESQKGYTKEQVQGLEFFIMDDLKGKVLEIDWKGIWLLGQFTVSEAE